MEGSDSPEKKEENQKENSVLLEKLAKIIDFLPNLED